MKKMVRNFFKQPSVILETNKGRETSGGCALQSFSSRVITIVIHSHHRNHNHPDSETSKVATTFITQKRIPDLFPILLQLHCIGAKKGQCRIWGRTSRRIAPIARKSRSRWVSIRSGMGPPPAASPRAVRPRPCARGAVLGSPYSKKKIIEPQSRP